MHAWQFVQIKHDMDMPTCLCHVPAGARIGTACGFGLSSPLCLLHVRLYHMFSSYGLNHVSIV